MQIVTIHLILNWNKWNTGKFIEMNSLEEILVLKIK